jgi:hypothetical protein
MPDYFVGYDLGKSEDYTARAVLRRTYNGRVTETGFYDFDLDCVQVEQIALGTPYTQVVADAFEFVTSHYAFAGASAVRLVIDATGVGTGVVEMFQERFGHFHSSIGPEIVAVLITCGAGKPIREGRVWHIPKCEVVMSTYAALASGRLRIDPRIKHAKMLKHELANYQTKTTESARTQFAAREGQHDDLIMALCLPTVVAGLPLYQIIPTDAELKDLERRMDETRAEVRQKEIEADKRREEEIKQHLLTLTVEREAKQWAYMNVPGQAAADWYIAWWRREQVKREAEVERKAKADADAEFRNPDNDFWFGSSGL